MTSANERLAEEIEQLVADKDIHIKMMSGGDVTAIHVSVLERVIAALRSVPAQGRVKSDDFSYATTSELAKEFVAYDSEAQAIQTQVERLHGATLEPVPDSPFSPPEFIAWYRKRTCTEKMSDEELMKYLNARSRIVPPNSIGYCEMRDAWIAASESGREEG
jgi:hypothetical protein